MSWVKRRSHGLIEAYSWGGTLRTAPCYLLGRLRRPVPATGDDRSLFDRPYDGLDPVEELSDCFVLRNQLWPHTR